MLEVRASGERHITSGIRTNEAEIDSSRLDQPMCSTLSACETKAMQVKAEAILGGDPQQAREVRRSIPTLRWFVDERYLPFVKGYKRSWKTDETVLRIHVLPELGRYFLDEIRPEFIIAVTNKMRGEGYASGTVARIIVILRYMFNLASKWTVRAARNERRIRDTGATGCSTQPIFEQIRGCSPHLLPSEPMRTKLQQKR